ncbi:chordin-like protein 1 [Antedon mediterranea]|uniref:chordin-like protein 1 n=1 Tax=Antedon mediterranea TaxID=105859 RepID=UPI003AF791B4
MGRDTYSVGSSWHPYFVQSGLDYCTLCTCLHQDDVSCQRIQCPDVTLCESVKSIAGQCCKQCTDSEENSTLGSSHSSIETAEESECRHGESTYRQGESFTLEEYSSVRPNQCTQCTCVDGHIECALRRCIPVPCKQPLYLPNSCCPICRIKEVEESQRGNNNSTQRLAHNAEIQTSELETRPTIILEDTEEKDRPMNVSGGSCKTDNGLYIHGQRWHPNVYPFGVMDCVVCHCINGEMNCTPVVCKKNEDLPCSFPVAVTGHCCPTCPDSNRVPFSNRPSIKAEPPMCLQQRENVVVYSTTPDKEKRSSGKGQEVSYVIERIDKKTVGLHQWILNNNGSIRSFQIIDITMREFADLLTKHPDKYTIEGATTNHKLRNLLNKEQKTLKNCDGNCKKQVRKITKVLRLRKVTRQENCPYNKTKARRVRKSKSRRG